MRTLRVSLVLFTVLGITLASCAQQPTPTATPVPAEPPTAVLPTDTAAAPTATPAPPTLTAVPPTATLLPPTEVPSPTLEPTATATEEPPAEPDPQLGMELWAQAPCISCHGAMAEGGIGPRLAGTGLSFDQLLATVRLGKGPMPAFSAQVIADQVLRHIHAWLRSLAAPTPTPIAAPTFPTQALSEMWYYVNEMRIRADFAKDLPARQAADDAGRLEIVKSYSGDGINQAQVVLQRANQALSDVPVESVRAIIRQAIEETNQVVNLFNQALAQSTYDAAWENVAEAVRICRIDTLPRATQAVRDAGLVGTVRVRVVDQAGNPIPGALVTALTAHTPIGVQADASGRVTVVNVAAVPALPVKAYAEGFVYHESNANLSPGATVESTITLPPLPSSGVAPAVYGAMIEPASGAGNATVTFAVTATDPQGQLDLAEDQIFALNPDIGLAYVLLHAGGDRYQVSVQLPNLGSGVHTWYFFAVDHECHMSSILPRQYTVQ
jgi:mono/diheme cytochrome c family protein